MIRWFAGTSWCRFRCKGFGARGVGNTELSDGRFIWPSGLVHYVEQHLVRLPDEFVRSVSLPPGPIPADPADFTVDTSWWCSQRGFGGTATTHLTPAPLGSLYGATASVQLVPQLLTEVRKCAATQARSLPEIRAIFQRGGRLLLLSDVHEADVGELRAALADLGLPTVFVPDRGAS